MRSIAVVVALLVGATAASAQPKNAAARLFDEGRALLKDKKFDEACEKFQKSFDLERSPGTEINLGDCAARDGKLGRAWELYDDAARSFDRTSRAGAAKVVREKMAALAPKLATIVVRVEAPNTAGLALRIGERPAAPAAEVTVLVDPGKIMVSATAPDKSPFSTEVDATAGKTTTVEVPSLGGKSIAVTGTTGGEGRRKPGRVRLAKGLAIGGAMVTGTALVVGGLAVSAYQDAEANGCHDDPMGRLVCDNAQGVQAANTAADRADVATLVGVGAAALFATAAIIYFTAPRENVTVRPLAAPGAVGFGISGRF